MSIRQRCFAERNTQLHFVTAMRRKLSVGQRRVARKSSRAPNEDFAAMRLSAEDERKCISRSQARYVVETARGENFTW